MIFARNNKIYKHRARRPHRRSAVLRVVWALRDWQVMLTEHLRQDWPNQHYGIMHFVPISLSTKQFRNKSMHICRKTLGPRPRGKIAEFTQTFLGKVHKCAVNFTFEISNILGSRAWDGPLTWAGGDLATRGASWMCWLKTHSFIEVCTACTWLWEIRFCKLLDVLMLKYSNFKESASLVVITLFTEKCSALPEHTCIITEESGSAEHKSWVAPSTSEWTTWMWSLRDSKTLFKFQLWMCHPEVCKIWFHKVMYT